MSKVQPQEFLIRTIISCQHHLSIQLTYFAAASLTPGGMRCSLQFPGAHSEPAQFGLTVKSAPARRISHPESSRQHLPLRTISPVSKGFSVNFSFVRCSSPVSSADAEAADITAHHIPCRQWVHPRIKYIHPAVLHRFSDRDRRCVSKSSLTVTPTVVSDGPY